MFCIARQRRVEMPAKPAVQFRPEMAQKDQANVICPTRALIAGFDSKRHWRKAP
jgi:hypothetical protein